MAWEARIDIVRIDNTTVGLGCTVVGFAWYDTDSTPFEPSECTNTCRSHKAGDDVGAVHNGALRTPLQKKRVYIDKRIP